MAHTVKTCLHGNQLDTCKNCPQVVRDVVRFVDLSCSPSGWLDIQNRQAEMLSIGYQLMMTSIKSRYE